jgi:hypothetical protein
MRGITRCPRDHRTAPIEHELGNIDKCLKAGFDRVVLVSSESKALNRVREAVGRAIAEDVRQRIAFLLPDELPAFLDSLPPAERFETVGGYKVKVEYRPASSSDQASRIQAVRDVIARSLGRLKPPG